MKETRMAESTHRLREPLSAEQLKFVERSLRSSFQIQELQHSNEEVYVSAPESEDLERILGMLKRYIYISKNLEQDFVFHNDVAVNYTADPQPALEEAREVIPVHPGFFTLQGSFLEVFKAVNRQVRRIAADLDAIEQEYPAIWPVRLFRTIDYFHEFPQQVIMCAPVRDDFSDREEFSKRYRKGEEFDAIQMDSLMAPAEYGLEPAVCDCCYYGLENVENLSDAFYTCYNKVFRNERSKSGRLDRLTNFSVRDIMFVGSRDFVLEARQTLIDRLVDFLKALRLRAKIETANDPFFANDSAMKAVFQNSHRLKYELLASIPHLEEEIAVGSINYHMDFFGNAFNISMPNGEKASSGCIGVGMERMTYALFCQNGPSLEAWPRDLLDFLEVEPD
jgi:hypothetical protein